MEVIAIFTVFVVCVKLIVSTPEINEVVEDEKNVIADQQIDLPRKVGKPAETLRATSAQISKENTPQSQTEPFSEKNTIVSSRRPSNETLDDIIMTENLPKEGDLISNELTIQIQKQMLAGIFWEMVFFGIITGITLGMLAMGGPPIMLFFLYVNFPKTLTRILGSSLGVLENPFRLVVTIISTYGGSEVDWSFDGDLPFLLACGVATNLGLFCGDRASYYVPQKQFEKLLLWLLAFAGVAILGLFENHISGWVQERNIFCNPTSDFCIIHYHYLIFVDF